MLSTHKITTVVIDRNMTNIYTCIYTCVLWLIYLIEFTFKPKAIIHGQKQHTDIKELYCYIVFIQGSKVQVFPPYKVYLYLWSSSEKSTCMNTKTIIVLV